MSLGKYSAVHSAVQPQDFEGGLRRDIRRLQTFLDGGKKKLLNELRKEMQQCGKALEFERAAALRMKYRC